MSRFVSRISLHQIHICISVHILHSEVLFLSVLVLFSSSIFLYTFPSLHLIEKVNRYILNANWNRVSKMYTKIIRASVCISLCYGVRRTNRYSCAGTHRQRVDEIFFFRLKSLPYKQSNRLFVVVHNIQTYNAHI